MPHAVHHRMHQAEGLEHQQHRRQQGQRDAADSGG
jgi:hypothetical protein